MASALCITSAKMALSYGPLLESFVYSSSASSFLLDFFLLFVVLNVWTLREEQIRIPRAYFYFVVR